MIETEGCSSIRSCSTGWAPNAANARGPIGAGHPMEEFRTDKPFNDRKAPAQHVDDAGLVVSAYRGSPRRPHARSGAHRRLDRPREGERRIRADGLIVGELNHDVHRFSPSGDGLPCLIGACAD